MSQDNKYNSTADTTLCNHDVENLRINIPETSTPDDGEQRLLHELRVHRIELDIQNEELRRTQHELDASRALYFDLYDLAPVGYLTVNNRGLIENANLAAAKMFGLVRKDLLQKPLSQYIVSEDQDVYYLHRKLLINANDVESWDMRMTKTNGTLFWAHLLVTPAYNGEIWINLTDITTRKQAEDDLRCYARRLIEMEENLRRQLATELHDEIGRDLTAIGMNISIVSDSVADGVAKNIKDKIQDSGVLLKGISRTVRGIMADLRPPVLDDFGLLAALRWHADIFSKRTGIAIFIQTDEPFARLTPEKETALFRIAQEALMNTAKYAGVESATITLWRVTNRILLSIIDEGNGFTPASSPHRQEGSGWGMKIMRERAELIGGNFHVDSAPGKGTVVSVTIPFGER